jgi:signal transduction histidine kinase
LLMLIPVHLAYLASVWSEQQSPTFVLVMTVGGTVAVVLGWFVAMLQHRAERQAFAAAAAIRRRKDELAAALSRVNGLLEERREIVAIVAHELQSPLAGMRALLRTVSDCAPADVRKLQEISRACGEMHGTIARLIDAHAAEVGGAKLESVDIDALFAQAAAGVAVVAAEKRIRIVCEPSWLRAFAESSLLGHALGNLVSNAVKYSPLGSAVRLKAEAHGAGVRISVSDRGPGIPLEEADLLFGKFARLSALPTAAEPSSGLGLYIVRILAERMGAAAGWEPNPEGGSIFFLDLRSEAEASG